MIDSMMASMMNKRDEHLRGHPRPSESLNDDDTLVAQNLGNITCVGSTADEHLRGHPAVDSDNTYYVAADGPEWASDCCCQQIPAETKTCVRRP